MSSGTEPSVYETDNVDECPTDYGYYDAGRMPPACVKCPSGAGYDFTTGLCFPIPSPGTATPSIPSSVQPTMPSASWWSKVPFYAKIGGGIALGLFAAWAISRSSSAHVG